MTGGANLIGGTFDAKTRATAVAVFMTSAPSGYAVGHICGQIIAKELGWGFNFLAFRLLTCGVSLLFQSSIDKEDMNLENTTPPVLGDFK